MSPCHLWFLISCNCLFEFWLRGISIFLLCTFIQDVTCFLSQIKFMLFEHFVAKSFKSFFFVFIIANDLIAVSLIWNENDMKSNHDLHKISIWNTRILVRPLTIKIGCRFPSVAAKKRKEKKKQSQEPPLFFAVFTRRIIDLNSQWIWKEVYLSPWNTQFLFTVKFCMFSP